MPLLPVVDDEEKLNFHDDQGESLYSNPPDPNMHTVDPETDEDTIFKMHSNSMNQEVLNLKNPYPTSQEMNIFPVWGMKMQSHHYASPAKYQKLHW